MAQYYNQYGAPPAQPGAENLQFYHGNYQSPQGGQSGYGVGSMGTMGGGNIGTIGGFRDQGGLRTGWLAAFSAEGYENEPPLLEELGVDFSHMRARTMAVLNPFSRIEQLESAMNDSDLAGPLLFVVLFGTFLLCSGKVHFGYIYGLALVGSTLLHMILSLMTPEATRYPGNEPSAGLTFTQSASVLGYCFLPLVLTSLLGVALPLDGTIGYILTSLAICWSTTRSSAIFCAVGKMRDMRVLVAYPVALFYVGFGIITIFNSRGNGTLAKAAAGMS
ncbi:Golgi integral membrane protein [Thozetella sp. PMI_491]|nr:Golgi integral membrane protein [Thozetella sp. PMI_491]